jgi:hypothetical protein
MRSVKKSSPARKLLGLGVLLVAVALVTLTGCGVSGSTAGFLGSHALLGSVRGGNQPVSGSSVQFYAAGISGVGSAAQPLLSEPVQSDRDGKFFIPASFRCPSPSSQIYVVARGGNPGLSSGTDNSALALEAMLGPCSSLSAANPILVDEVTTVGSVWPLAHYMKSPVDIGSAGDDAAFVSAVDSVPEFVNLVQGSSPGIATATSYFAQSSKLYSLADVLSNCVNSSGGSAGDSSPCGLLFSMATPPGGTPPTDTITAAMEIAQNPDNNVTDIFGLVRANTPFKPTLSTAPPDWTLRLTYAVATPSISLGTGTYAGAQEVTINDSTAGSTIHYTADGTVPTSSSPSYAGAISIAATSIVQAIAVLNGSQSAVASSTLTITAEDPTPVRLAFVQQPSNSVARSTISPAVRVAVEDASGNVVSSAADPVTLALVDGTGLAGTLTVTPQNGVATFSDLTVSTPGTGLTLLATSPQMSFADSATFTISAPGSGTASTPAKLAFLQQPSNALPGATITPAVQVAVEDSNGNVVESAAGAVTLGLSSGTGLGGTLTVAAQNGIATFTDLNVSNPGSYTLSASSPSLGPATSSNFIINTASLPAVPAKLAFVQQPSNSLTGAIISPAVAVAVEDSNGNTVTTPTTLVTLTLSGGGGLSGTLTATTQNGIATFNNLSVGIAGSYTLSAASSDIAPATSSSFNITATAGGSPTSPVKLTFLVQPSNAQTHAAISPAVQVAVEDSNGTIVSSAANPVTIALVGSSGLEGTLTVTPQNGIAIFNNLSVSDAGSYTISATSPGLTSATSSGFTINAPSVPPTAARLAFVQQPSNTLTQAVISPPVTVAVEDSDGKTVTTATNPVTLTLSGGTSLAGTLTATPQNGVATFSNLTVSAAGSYTLSAASPSLSPAISTGFSITAPSVPPIAAKLAFLVQPANAVTGATISPAVQVTVQDANGSTVTSATNPVTLALTGTGALGGTLTASPQNGVATFGNLTVNTAGSYTLNATSPGLTPATSTSFSITAGSSAPPSISCSGSPNAVTPGGTALLTAVATSPEGRALIYTWSTSSGMIIGAGPAVTLSTTGASAGSINVTCTVTDSQGLTASSTTAVTVTALTSGSLQPSQCVKPTITQPPAIVSTPVTLIVPANAINVLQNGATGNGQTNDTPALQAIVNSNPNGFIYFPPGNYVLNNSDINTPGLLFSGFHGTAYVANGSRFLCENATTTAGQCIEVLNSSDATFDNFRIGYVDESGLPLSRSDAISNGMLVENCTSVTFNNTTVEASTGSGIWTTGSTYLSFLNGTSVSNTAADGIHFENVGNGVLTGFTSINTGDDAIGATNIATSNVNCGMNASNLQIFQSHSRGIAAAGSCGYNFSNFYIQDVSNSGVGALQDPTISSRVPTNNTFTNGTIVNAGTYPSAISGNKDCMDANISTLTTFSNVECYSPGSDGVYLFQGADQVTISGVSVDAAPNAGFQTGDATNIQFLNTISRNSGQTGYSLQSTQTGSLVGAATCSSGTYGFYHSGTTGVTESGLLSYDSDEGASSLHRAWWAENGSGPITVTGFTVLDDQSHSAPVIVGGVGDASGSLVINGLVQDLVSSTLQVQLP